MNFFRDRCPACNHQITQRTEFQNTELHVLCARLARLQSWPPGSGKKRNVMFWKRLAICTWERAHGRDGEAVEGLDGEMDFIYTRTSRMTEKEMQGLIEMLKGWMHTKGGPD